MSAVAVISVPNLGMKIFRTGWIIGPATLTVLSRVGWIRDNKEVTNQKFGAMADDLINEIFRASELVDLVSVDRGDELIVETGRRNFPDELVSKVIEILSRIFFQTETKVIYCKSVNIDNIRFDIPLGRELELSSGLQRGA